MAILGSVNNHGELLNFSCLPLLRSDSGCVLVTQLSNNTHVELCASPGYREDLRVRFVPEPIDANSGLPRRLRGSMG